MVAVTILEIKRHRIGFSVDAHITTDQSPKTQPQRCSGGLPVIKSNHHIQPEYFQDIFNACKNFYMIVVIVDEKSIGTGY